jgi:hypothetical protein
VKADIVRLSRTVARNAQKKGLNLSDDDDEDAENSKQSANAPKNKVRPATVKGYQATTGDRKAKDDFTVADRNLELDFDRSG